MATTDEKIISLGVLSYNNDKIKEYIQEEIDKIPSSAVDDTLSDTSENPVQNKVINAALNSKADQTAVDVALAQKANSADVTASLAGKSDTGHTHDDRYYTESETNTLLGDKVGVSAFNSHTNDTTVHVTAEEKSAWNGKAELSDIPSTLPANGGNAEKVGGYSSNHILKYIASIPNNDCNDFTEAGWHLFNGCDGHAPGSDSTIASGTYFILLNVQGSVPGYFVQVATFIHGAVNYLGKTYIRHCNNGVWTEWGNIADGGNSTYVQGYAPKDSGTKGLPVITSDYGPLEIGKYLDFHTADGQDYKVRITANDDGTLSFSGAINANTTGSAATITSTLPVTKGGTGQTTARAAANSLISSLEKGDSIPEDEDYYVCQYAGGGESNTNYYRRPTSKMYDYINQKLKASKDFLQNLGTWSKGNIDDLILAANKSGTVWIESKVTGMPVEGKYWFGIIDCSNAHRCLRVTSQTDGQSFVRAYNSGTQYWYAWHNLSDGGNADTLDGMHASDITLSFVNKYKPLVVSVAPTSNSVLLGWLPVDGATKYAVARYDPITQKYINISTEITNTNYTVTGLSSDTTYQFLVQAWINNKWSTFTTSDHIITNTLPDYNISAGTEDLSAGVSELATGAIYLVYE